jgi:hypothetical protein
MCPQVFESTGHNTEATVKALLSMTSEAQPTEAIPATSRSPEGASGSKGPELASDEPAGLPNLWDDLPEECKQLVLEKLSPLDAARAARVNCWHMPVSEFCCLSCMSSFCVRFFCQVHALLLL